MLTRYLLILFIMIFSMCGCSSSKEQQNVTEQDMEDVYLSQIVRYADSLYGIVSADTLSPEVDGLSDSAFVLLSDVAPDIIQEIRYYTTFNFVGRRIPGYEAPIALLTHRAADSLRRVSEELMAEGYRLKVFDAYRPQRAVLYFVGWARQDSDTLMKLYFYPDIDKADSFRLGYLAHRSGHARGSTVDVTLFDVYTGRDLDMGGPYDFFGPVSHYNYREGLTQQQMAHRQLLRRVMARHGFKPVGTEWWHFTLVDEPYPERYFDFPIQTSNLMH